MRLAPKWGKGYGRKGAALTGLGQGGEAVKAYLAGLAVEPESEALRGGLAEAKAAIRAAQDRYKEMWGKDAPPTDAVDAEAPPPPVETPKAPAGDRVFEQGPRPAAAAAEDLSAADQTAPSRDDVKENVAPLAPEVAAVTAAVNALDKSDVRAWLAAAKDGDLARMKAMHSRNPALLYAWGKGTSLGFTANSAQHWAAAKGRVDVIRWLLAQGMSPDVRNNADSTPLHSAAGAGQDGSIRALLLEGGADSTLRNGLDETPRDVAVGRKKGDGDSLAATIDLCSRVAQLASAKAAGEAWPMRLMQAALQLAGRDLRMYSEKSEFIAATEELLGSMPSRIVPSGGGATLPMPSLFARPEKGEAEPAKGGLSRLPRRHRRQPPRLSPPPPTAGAPPPAATTRIPRPPSSPRCPRRPNRRVTPLSGGDYLKAVKQFTMAIRMDKQNHVLFSNRSASYAALGKYEEALADAERCVRLAPKWGKGYGRKGAALTGARAGRRGCEGVPGGSGCGARERGASRRAGGGKGGDTRGAGQVQGDVGQGRPGGGGVDSSTHDISSRDSLRRNTRRGVCQIRVHAAWARRLLASGVSPSASSPPPSLGHSITMSTPIRHTALPTTSPTSGLKPSSPYPAAVSQSGRVSRESERVGWELAFCLDAHPTGTTAR